MRLPRFLTPRTVVSAHCDLPCGVYDPAQARIEAESVKAIQEKYQANTDPEFRTRAILIKEQRAELVKHHLWVLWTDYFKPPHFEKYPQLHELFNQATKQAGATGGKGSPDPSQGPKPLDLIHQIAEIFWETKKRSLQGHGGHGGPRHGGAGRAWRRRVRWPARPAGAGPARRDRLEQCRPAHQPYRRPAHPARRGAGAGPRPSAARPRHRAGPDQPDDQGGAHREA